MKLVILNGIKEGIKDAFIKQDNYNLTIGYPSTEGEFMWYIDGNSGKFSKCHTYLNSTVLPENAGIFKVYDNVAELFWCTGDINIIKQRFQELTGFNITDNPNVSEPEKTEAEQLEPAEIFEMPLSETEKAPDNFWECNEISFNEIFNSNPENTVLNELIPGSKWVTITDDNYVFGVIYDENQLPLYLCYGFPLPWSETPPEKLEGYCQWIPVDFQKPHDDGFWVIYINAQTGERVR